jgi:hypothetical protein
VNTHEHIDELAELYALGALDDEQRRRIDMHVGDCAECAARLGDAEALIAQTVAQREPPQQLDRRVRSTFTPQTSVLPRWSGLIAAAFVIGLLPGFLFAMLYRPAAPFQQDRERAIAAMVNSHFLHAPFTPIAADAPKAKVLYGRNKGWRFFVAQTHHAYLVQAQTANGPVILGTLHVSGNAAELFVGNSRARQFVLLDGARPVARARLP